MRSNLRLFKLIHSLYPLTDPPSAMDQLNTRLGVARTVLERLAESPNHIQASRAQALAAVDLATRAQASLTSCDRAALVDLASAVPFTSNDMNEVLAAILGPSTSNVKRRPLQSFETFVNYLTDNHWERLLDPESTPDFRTDLTFTTLGCLSLRNPSEMTLKLLNSFLIMLSNNWESCLRMSTYSKKCAWFR